MKNKEEIMDYSKLTKDQLIEQLNELKHAVTTVQAKDKEISELNRKVQLLEATKEKLESDKLQEAIETNKELVDENRELVADMRYLIQVFNVFLNNFQNNAGLVQVLLKKYLNGGQ